MTYTLFFDELKTAIYSELVANHCSHFVAESVSHGLTETSLRGVDSHGIRLLPHYLNGLKAGRINGQPNFSFTDTFPCFHSLDADNTFGHAAGFAAIDHCCNSAKLYGISACTVKNSSHPGAMASFAYRAASQGFASFAFTHADSLVQSVGSKSKFFGTNPICFGAPRSGSDHPFCLDLAPTYIPWNEILNSIESSRKLKGLYAVTQDGFPTDDPHLAKALLPIAGYKGFALAAMVEVLCSCFSGMNYGPNIPTMYGAPISKPRHLGQFYVVMRTDIELTSDQFSNYIQQLSDDLRSSDSSGSVLCPNDPQINNASYRNIHGIPIPDPVWDIIKNRL